MAKILKTMNVKNFKYARTVNLQQKLESDCAHNASIGL